MKADIKCPKCRGKLSFGHCGAELWCQKCKAVAKHPVLVRIYNEGFEVGEATAKSRIKQAIGI